MAYLGSAAYRLENVEQVRERSDMRPTFDVIEGGGADARARRGISASFVAKVKLAVVAVGVFALLGAARVGITAMTVSELADNVSLESQIAEAESTNSDLRIERSILSSSARIDRIAVQNYGMAMASDRDVVVLPAQDVATVGDDESLPATDADLDDSEASEASSMA